MKTITLVEDDAAIARLLTRFLEGKGFSVVHVADGEQAINDIRAAAPDVVLLDLLLPGMDGIEVCKTVRAFYNGPILMLTAHASEINEITALDTGIDDFIAKPLKPQVLLSRINALLRRTSDEQDTLFVHDLELNLSDRVVMYEGKALNISDSDYQLFAAIAQAKGDVVSRETLFEIIRGIPFDGIDRSIDMRVSKLRKKLNEQASADKDYIRTIRGRGYLTTGTQ
ncbi:MAG: response regulator transcription factor [Pseudomonadota bacterium]